MLYTEMNEIGQFIPLHYHFQMLSDDARMTAFRTAIEEVVKPGLKVAELGSGTGVLSFFAARQGAQVWSVEFNPTLVAASRHFLNENGMAGKVHVSQGDAATWLPPEPVDLVICEMLHSALLREKQVQVITSFRDAHQARFGKTPQFVPGDTLLGVQPVHQSFDFNGYYAPVPLFQSPYYTTDDCQPCGNPALYKTIDYANIRMEPIEGEVNFCFDKETRVNALRFITKNLLTMNMFTGKTVDWHNQYLVLPLSKPLELKTGETLQVHFSYKPGDHIEALVNSIGVDILEKGGKAHQWSMIA